MSPIILLLFFLGILFFFFIIGFPVGYGLVLTTLALMLLGIGGGLQPSIVAIRMFWGVNSFSLLAIPFFLFAGKVMNLSGLTNRLFDFAESLVGRIRGGLCHVNIMASMIFAGMTGVAVADAGGLGAIEYEAMTKAKYPKKFSIGVTAASTTIGPILPPSVPMVIYAVLASVSVGQALIAGLVPGVLIGVCLMILSSIVANIKSFPQGPRFTFKNIARGFRRGFLALLTPLILLGGIVSGIFTVTEASAIAAFYALMISMFVYKCLTWKNVWKISIETMMDSATILLLLSAASAYGYMVTISGLPQIFANILLSISENPTVILLFLNIFLLIIGTFLEAIAAITIFVPIFLPLTNMVGINPLHFGVIVVLNLMIGLLTPPFGIVLFTLEKATDLKFDDILKGVFPFYIPLVTALLLLTFFPAITLCLPNLFFN